MSDEVIQLGRGQILIGNYLVDAYEVQMKPHRADYELFESYDGLISIRKMLDQHTELSFKTLITESIVENYDPYNRDNNREEFISFRKKFLDDIDGQTIVVISEMFKPFKGVVTAKEYTVSEGETASEYKIEVKEAGGSIG